jgi:hypothetical protein
MGKGVGSDREIILKHVTKHCGPVDDRHITQIVPSAAGVGVAVHVVRPNPKSGGSLLLFTTGMSDLPMTVPDDVDGAERYVHAELVISLPRAWPLPENDTLREDDHHWPIEWLFRVGAFPHQRGTWLGGPFTVYAVEDPPQPLAPNTALSCVLLLADAYRGASEYASGAVSKNAFSRVRCSRDKEVFFYSLLPLYTEERDLEMSEGIGRLFELLDMHRVPLQVDLARVNVALSKG